MPATVAPVPIPQFFGNDGTPGNGFLLFTYEAGTVTPVAVYQDSDLSIPWPNPITMTSSGRPSGPIFPPLTPALKYILQDANGVTLWTADNVAANASAS